MSGIKVMKQLQKQNERKSLVKELISLRPISPVVLTETHPLQTLYHDSNPPPQQVDQFDPYLSRKMSMKRQEKVNKIKGNQSKESPTFALTAQRSSVSTSQQQKRPPLIEPLQQNDNYYDRTRPRTSMKTTNEQNLLQHIRMENTFDKIASNASTVALNKLIESTLQIYFLADNVYYYHDISSVKVLYCPTTTSNCPHGSGIVGYTQFTRKSH